MGLFGGGLVGVDGADFEIILQGTLFCLGLLLTIRDGAVVSIFKDLGGIFVVTVGFDNLDVVFAYELRMLFGDGLVGIEESDLEQQELDEILPFGLFLDDADALLTVLCVMDFVDLTPDARGVEKSRFLTFPELDVLILGSGVLHFLSLIMLQARTYIFANKFVLVVPLKRILLAICWSRCKLKGKGIVKSTTCEEADDGL